MRALEFKAKLVDQDKVEWNLEEMLNSLELAD